MVPQALKATPDGPANASPAGAPCDHQANPPDHRHLSAAARWPEDEQRGGRERVSDERGRRDVAEAAADAAAKERCRVRRYEFLREMRPLAMEVEMAAFPLVHEEQNECE